MPECPVCLGDGAHDFSAFDVPLARLARLFGGTYEPAGIVTCPDCSGTGVVSAELARQHEAWAVARVDQFLAAVDAGEIVVP